MWKDSTFHTYSEADGLGSDLVGAVTRDQQGALWVGTLRGLTRFKDGRFQTFAGPEGLASNVVTALRNDDWRVCFGSVRKMADCTACANGKIFHYAAGLGLPASIFAIVDDAKFLWLTSQTGIYRVAKAEFDALAMERPSPAVAQYGTADGMRVNECSEGGHPAAWRATDGALWFATLRGVSTIDARPRSNLTRATGSSGIVFRG